MGNHVTKRNTVPSNQEVNPAWRNSFTTSWAGGTSTPPERRSRDAAKTLAEAHAKRDPHRKRHVVKWEAPSLALAWANKRTNVFVSLDHRPPISPASTTRRALALRPINSGKVRSFHRRASAQLHLCEQHLGALSHRSATGNQRGVHSELGASEWWQTVSDDLQPPPTSCHRHWKVQVAKHDVRRHSGASFAAQSSGTLTTHTHNIKMDWPKTDWPKTDWPQTDWPKMAKTLNTNFWPKTDSPKLAGKTRWPKTDWPKSVMTGAKGRGEGGLR